MIGEAGESAGLSAKFLHSIFPGELTLWVDPLEVSYRIGENGSICVLYEFQVRTIVCRVASLSYILLRFYSIKYLTNRNTVKEQSDHIIG